MGKNNQWYSRENYNRASRPLLTVWKRCVLAVIAEYVAAAFTRVFLAHVGLTPAAFPDRIFKI